MPTKKTDDDAPKASTRKKDPEAPEEAEAEVSGDNLQAMAKEDHANSPVDAGDPGVDAGGRMTQGPGTSASVAEEAQVERLAELHAEEVEEAEAPVEE